MDGCEILHLLRGGYYPTISRVSTIQADVGFLLITVGLKHSETHVLMLMVFVDEAFCGLGIWDGFPGNSVGQKAYQNHWHHQIHAESFAKLRMFYDPFQVFCHIYDA